jgi:hypothetical protein
VPDEKAPGTAVIAGPKSSGYTLMGLPTVRATVEVSQPYAQLDSRLWDLAPDGNRVLVSRGAYRLETSQSGKPITFQLHGNGWRFEPGHVPQLELLGQDPPYLRPSNTAFSLTVSKVTVELPTLERPGSATGVLTPSLGRKQKPRLRVKVRPRRVRAGKRKRFAFVVRGRRNRGVRGAGVRFAGKRARTGRRGRARIVVRFRRRGLRSVRATKKGYRPGRARVRVLRRR